MTTPLRVFQVATGNLGTEMVKRIGDRPDLVLVGLHCYTTEKIGRDAGEIVGLPPIGVLATGTVEEIIAAKPDVLTFHGVFPDEDLYVKVLEAGINIVTTADWITGVFSYELGACTEDVDLGWYHLPKGSLGANYLKYQGIVDGVPKIEVHIEWQMTRHTEPRWKVQHAYITKIAGDPCITSTHKMHPKPGVDIYSPATVASIGMTITGMPALNAIAAVVDAPPGLLTSADIPLRGFAGRFKT